MTIIEESRKLFKKSNDSYVRGAIWDKNGGNYRDLINIINNIETPEEVFNILKDRDMYNITIRSQKKFDLMMKWNRNLYPIPDFVTTPNLAKMFFYCKNISTSLNKEIKTILELGGGNGQFANIANQVLKNETHVDIDLPESLYMAYVCTRHLYPEAKCIWITDETDVKLDDYDFVFIPVQRENILKGKEFDLFVNTASMGEMSNQNVRYWMNFIQNEVHVKYFFGFNRFLNTIPKQTNDNWNRIRQNENEASVIFDNKWDVLKWEVEPDFSRCPYEDPRIARYLLIILKRSETPLKDNEDIDEIKEQDWWCYRDVGAMATHRHNQLVNDYTMTGVLYRLWNSIRLGNKEAVPMILEYLNNIGRNDFLFEEELYYRGLR